MYSKQNEPPVFWCGSERRRREEKKKITQAFNPKF